MESILMEIFRGCYEVNDGAVPSLEGYRKAQETCQKVWDEAEKVLGPEAQIGRASCRERV